MAEVRGPRKARPLLDDTNSKFARALGSVDFHTREAGLRALQDFLSRRSSLEELEMLRLWKGIFYCFWHSDKQPVQVRTEAREAACMLRAVVTLPGALLTPLSALRRLLWLIDCRR